MKARSLKVKMKSVKLFIFTLKRKTKSKTSKKFKGEIQKVLNLLNVTPDHLDSGLQLIYVFFLNLLSMTLHQS